VLCIAFCLAFQYGVAPRIVEASDYVGYIRDAWISGCDQFTDTELVKACAGNNGVYRASGATTLFFLLAAIAALLKPTANREAWPAKYILYIFLVAATAFIPSDPLFSPVYLNIGRST
jgi:hypothetical protein